MGVARIERLRLQLCRAQAFLDHPWQRGLWESCRGIKGIPRSAFGNINLEFCFCLFELTILIIKLSEIIFVYLFVNICKPLMFKRLLKCIITIIFLTHTGS